MAFLKGIIERWTRGAHGTDSARASVAHLAVFGKHPGWDDHIDDIGVDTEPLVRVKRSLYLQGIRGNVDAGTWDKLDSARRLEKFNHFFIWQGIGSVVAGRLVASADGKGRSRYPMVVCVDCGDMELSDVVKRVCPQLSQTLDLCQQTKSQLEVRRIVQESQNELSLITSASNSSADSSVRLLADLVRCAALGPEGTSLLSVLYQLRREMGHYGQEESIGKAVHCPPAQLRVPTCAAEPAVAIQQWLHLVSDKVAAGTPTLGIAAVDGGWIDLLIGETQIEDFYCLQASRETLPFTTDIPYSMDPEFTASATRELERYRAG